MTNVPSPQPEGIGDIECTEYVPPMRRGAWVPPRGDHLIRLEVQRIFPGLPPYKLTDAAMCSLALHLRLGDARSALRHLAQQAMLCEAFAAWLRGEDVTYLQQRVKPWN